MGEDGAAALWLQRRTQCSLRVCTPSFNERSECPEEGWPVGPGRSRFSVSSATAKLVKSVGPLLSLLPRRFRVDPSSGRAFGAEGGRGRRWRCCLWLQRECGGALTVQPSSAHPPSTSVASARRRGGPAGPGRSLFTVSITTKPMKSIGPLQRLLPRRFRVDPSSGRAFGAEGGSGRRWSGWFVVGNEDPAVHSLCSRHLHSLLQRA